MVSLPINLPKIVTAEDYHEFVNIQCMFSKFGADVNFREFDTKKAPYAAIFFLRDFDDRCEELINKFNGK